MLGDQKTLDVRVLCEQRNGYGESGGSACDEGGMHLPLNHDLDYTTLITTWHTTTLVT